MLHTPRSCPHWRSTHPFLHQFDWLSTTRLWARHVAYSSIMPTLEMNTTLPSLIQLAYYCKIMSTSRCIQLDHAHIGDQHAPSFVDSIGLVLKIMSTSRCILLDHAHIGYQHNPSFVDSIHSTTRLWARHIAYSSIITTLEINTSLPLSIRFT
jgi:hypothetical protein